MKKTVHKANTRGYANYGWLETHHSFSFAHYNNPERVHFGALRVLNDDIIYPGMGFDTHPHDNMEIITIPLQGALQHKDTSGGSGIIRKNEIQVMSAGSGLQHSEYAYGSDLVSLLQIWIFTKKQNIKPRYDQKPFESEDRINHFQLVVSPDGSSGSLSINQDAWLYLGTFEENQIIEFKLHSKNNGVYLFIISGEIFTLEECLDRRDGIEISEIDKITIKTTKPSELLLIEVPM